MDGHTQMTNGTDDVEDRSRRTAVHGVTYKVPVTGMTNMDWMVNKRVTS
jgi:hypothetical protein